MTEILVVANETLNGRRLRELLAQKAKVNESLAIRLVIPQSRPADSSAICFIAGAKLIPDTSLRAFWDDTLGLSR